MRYIGVDLHTTQLTACYLTEDGTEQSITTYKLEEVERFLAQLCVADELAVEATGNTRWFVTQVKGRVNRVVIVNPRQFLVIRKSIKKTDRHDAAALARFLRADLLPEVREKSLIAERVQSLNSTRTQLVRLRTSLQNKIHSLAVSRGWKLKKESLSSEKGLTAVFEREWSAGERLELEIIACQIRALNESVKKLDKLLAGESATLEGFENLVSIGGIGSRSAGVLLSVIGDVADFESADKLAAYFGIVPRVSNSAERVRSGRISKQGSKTGRTTLVQCVLVAIRRNEYLRRYYEQIKARRGHGKAKIAVARKFLTVIYQTLKNKWVFADFNNFVLAE